MSYGIFDEWLLTVKGLLEEYGWYLVFTLMFLYYFEIPSIVSKIPGKLIDMIYGASRKKVLDKEVRRVRRFQQEQLESDKKKNEGKSA